MTSDKSLKMKKVLKIDLSENRLLAMASDYLDEHNYLGALRMLNKNAEVNGNAAESYMLYAETYDDMGLYDESINSWFKYIDYTHGSEYANLADAYEGIAVNFRNRGDGGYAVLYYHLMAHAASDGHISGEFFPVEEYEGGFRQPSPLKVKWPPEHADYSEEMEEGVFLMHAGSIKKAIAAFNKVQDGSSDYLAAQNYIAMCHLLLNHYKAAEKICLAVLQRDKNNVKALTSLASIRNYQNRNDDARAIARTMLGLGLDKPEDLYAVATVCCETGMHEEAYGLFCRLQKYYDYDSTMLYFTAVSAYNSGRKSQSLEAFDKLQTIYPGAVTARYYSDFVRSHLDADDEDYKTNPVTYFYRLPESLREANIELLSSFCRLNKKQAKQFSREVDMSDCILWCFEQCGESYRFPFELKLLGMQCAATAEGCDDILRDLLLDINVPDLLKTQAIGLIAARNKGASYGIVISNLYYKMEIPKLCVGAKKRKTFVDAYAYAISRLAMSNPARVPVLNGTAVSVYNALAQKDNLSVVDHDIPTLAAVLCYESDFGEPKRHTITKSLELFGGDNKLFKAIIKAM